MYMWVRGIAFPSFYHCSIALWNCSDSFCQTCFSFYQFISITGSLTKNISLTSLTPPHFRSCPRNWISNVICRDIFCVLWVQWGWEVIVRFIFIDGIDHHRWLNFLVTIWVWNCFCFNIRFWNCSNNVWFFVVAFFNFNHIPNLFRWEIFWRKKMLCWRYSLVKI